MTASRPSSNRASLEAVARRLAPLLDDLVFVGGQITEFLITDPAAVRIRSTDDVDAIVEVTTRTQYERLSERLRAHGLRLDLSEGAPVCRWVTPEAIKVDVMPVDGSVFGLSADWFAYTVESAMRVRLGDALAIRIATAPAFLATKWAAFADRGGGDLIGSHDVEDIVAVTAGRDMIVTEVLAAPPELRAYLARRTSDFVAAEVSSDVVAGALPDSRFDPAIVERTLERFRAIAAAQS